MDYHPKVTSSKNRGGWVKTHLIYLPFKSWCNTLFLYYIIYKKISKRTKAYMMYIDYTDAFWEMGE